MIACVIASFVVTWTPNHLLTLSMLLIDKNQPWMFYWNSVTQVLALLFLFFFSIFEGVRQRLGDREPDHLRLHPRGSASRWKRVVPLVHQKPAAQNVLLLLFHSPAESGQSIAETHELVDLKFRSLCKTTT